MLDWIFLTDKVQAKFKELGTQSPTVRRAIDAFARVLLNRIKMGFRTSRSPAGASWKPLNPKLTRTGQPLVDTGRLRNSVGSRRDGDAVVIGTNLRTPKGGYSLGAVHQFGAVIVPQKAKFLVWSPKGGKGLIFAKRVTIPARPFMPVTANGIVDLPPAWAQSALKAMAAALEVAA